MLLCEFFATLVKGQEYVGTRMIHHTRKVQSCLHCFNIESKLKTSGCLLSMSSNVVNGALSVDSWVFFVLVSFPYSLDPAAAMVNTHFAAFFICPCSIWSPFKNYSIFFLIRFALESTNVTFSYNRFVTNLGGLHCVGRKCVPIHW